MATSTRATPQLVSHGKRIVFTGGSGLAGRHVIPYLLSRGHQVLNLDLVPLHHPSVHTIRTDITNPGAVFSALTSHFRLSQPLPDPPIQIPDAVIHFAGYARNLIVPDTETFSANVAGVWNVLEAACKVGVRKVVIASSVAVYGVSYGQGDGVGYPSFPIDEAVECVPSDAYAISKLCAETVARGFAKRFGVDIYVLRLGHVVVPEEYREWFFQYVNKPSEFKGHGWSYVDVRDLGQMCDLCVERDGLGFQVFNATNDKITILGATTTEFLRKECPNTPFTRKMGDKEAPTTNRKIKEMLRFNEEWNWKDIYK